MFNRMEAEFNRLQAFVLHSSFRLSFVPSATAAAVHSVRVIDVTNTNKQPRDQFVDGDIEKVVTALRAMCSNRASKRAQGYALDEPLPHDSVFCSVEVGRHSSSKGNALFAAETIEPGQIIGVLDGPRILATYWFDMRVSAIDVFNASVGVPSHSSFMHLVSNRKTPA